MTKKEIILNTTLRLIAEQGILATPMSQIQEESGVATGTIYHHFKSKEEIINFLYVQEKVFFKLIAQNHIKENTSYKNNFCCVLNAICDFYIENEKTFYFFQQVANSKYLTEESKEKANEYLTPIANFIQHGIESNEVENAPVALLLELLHSNVSVYVALVLKNQTSEQGIRESLLNYSWKAIKK